MQLGTVIARRFELVRVAGSGGMGTVFEAHDREQNGRVAVKIWHSAPPGVEARFEREARILADLAHPGFVRYIAHGTTARRPYLVTEWLEGEDLAARLRRGPLSVSSAVTLMVRVSTVLTLAHQRQIVHRDIKPANLWLVGREVDEVKILDLGLARSIMPDRISISRTGAFVGTPSYMAPEQARGSSDLDVRADVFSLGCVLYECLTGFAAFGGEHVMAVLAKILLDDPPHLMEVCPRVPPALDALVLRMLARDRNKRPASAAEIAGELLAIQRASEPPERPKASAVPAFSGLTAREQRVLCVLVAGRSGLNTADSTESGTSLDIDEMMARHDQLRSIAERHGGRLELLANGCLVATFSSAGQATDLATQAARSALLLRTLLPNAALALATGRALIGQSVSFGEAVERASAILIESSAGEVHLDDVSARLLDSRFLLDQNRVIRERELPAGERRLLGKPTACVGREWELATLHAAFEECMREHSPRVALVTAPAGIGKSRVRNEFLRSERVQDAEIWIALGDSMRAGAPLGLLAQIVCWSLGINAAVPLDIQHKVLRARTGRFLESAAAERIAMFLGELIGAPFPDSSNVALRAARQDPMLMADQTLRAWKDWMAAESAAHGTVLVFEDLHWGDLPTIKFVEEALRELNDRPIFVLALARPEVHDKFPRLWAELGAVEIHLRKLSRRASEHLVFQVLGTETNPKLVEQIVERAEGNAFYLEELLRSVAEGGGDLPASVIAMLELRLAALPEELRLVLRAGSIFGGVFSASAVAFLLGYADPAVLGPRLAKLVDTEWISRARDSRFFGEDIYTFRHDLVREAAYGALTEEDRALGHRVAADWLEKAGEHEAIVIAEHRERAGQREGALAWYQRAAEQALEGNDLQAAIARAERAAECGAQGTTLGALRVLQAEAHNWRAEWHAAKSCAEEAIRLLPVGSALWAHALHQSSWVRAATLVGSDEIEGLAQELLAHGVRPMPRLYAIACVHVADHLMLCNRTKGIPELVDRLLHVDHLMADPMVAGNVAHLFGRREAFHGRLASALRHFTRSVEQFELAENRRSSCLAQDQRGAMLFDLGLDEEADRTFGRKLSLVQQLGLPAFEAYSKIQLALLRARQNQMREALALGRSGVDAMAAASFVLDLGHARSQLSRILYAAREYEAAEREALRALENTNPRVELHAEALASYAQALCARNKPSEARYAAERAVRLLDRVQHVHNADAFIRLVYVECLHALGDRAALLAAITDARVHLLHRAALIADQPLATSFLTRVPENARTLALANSLLGP